MRFPPKAPAIVGDEVAAAGGSYIAAVVEKLDVLAAHALTELAEAGAFVANVQQFGAWAVDHSSVPPGVLFDELLDSRGGFYAFAAQVAIDFMADHKAPADDEPWPVEYAAAHLLLDVYLFGHRVLELRLRLQREEVLELAGVAELVWIAMRVGAMSEAFRPGSRDMAARVAEARQLLAQRSEGGRRGARSRVEKADAWRTPALQAAGRFRNQNPKAGQKAVAEHLAKLNIAGLPKHDRVVRWLSEVENEGMLALSTSNPKNKSRAN